MSNKGSFTAEEWEIVAGLPPMAAAAASVSDGVALIGTIREMNAGVHAIRDGATAYPNNELIQSVIAEMADPRVADGVDDQAVEEPHRHDDHDPEGFVREVVLSAAQARDILAAKALPNEAAAYGEWVVAIVTRVIETTRSGGFLGIGGHRVGDAEARFRDELVAALRGQ